MPSLASRAPARLAASRARQSAPVRAQARPRPLSTPPAAAAAAQQPDGSDRASPRIEGPRQLTVLNALAAAVEAQAQVQRFEQFAGRSAMIGVFVALAAELLTERSLFSAVEPSQLASAVWGTAGAVLASGAAAAASKRQLGIDLREAVLTSLTAAQRSAASVSGVSGVDWAVDAVLNSLESFRLNALYAMLSSTADDEDETLI